jgi:hypothetical protein
VYMYLYDPNSTSQLTLALALLREHHGSYVRSLDLSLSHEDII